MPYPGFTNFELPALNSTELITNITGLAVDTWHSVSERLNVTFTIQAPPDQSWGSKRDDGSFTGIVGQLEQGNIDMGILFMSFTLERSQAITYVDPGKA